MMRKLTTLLAAAAVALTALAPATPADARHRRDRDYGYDCRYDRDCDRYGRHDRYDRRHYRDRDDNDDEIAAGVLGLVLGVAVGAMVANSNSNRQAPPAQRRYYNDMRGSAYDRDYGYEDPYYDRAPQCTRTERQYDRYARRYVMVDVPC